MPCTRLWRQITVNMQHSERQPETRITAELALRAYQKILDAGERFDGEFRLKGLSAVEDFDGYGITLKDDAVTLRVLFHNRVAIDTPNRRALARFRKRLRNLVRDPDGRA